MEAKYTVGGFVALTALATAGVTVAGCQGEAVDKAAEANMAIERRICEEPARATPASLDQTCTANWVCHHPLGGDITLEQFKAGFAGLLIGLPDFKVVPDGMFAAGEKVALRITWQRTDKGVLMGAQPTGKQLA